MRLRADGHQIRHGAHLDRLINQLHHGRDHLLLCICNSGRRSIAAASLLRSLGYPEALSVAGGFQVWKKLQTPPALPTPWPATA